MKPLLVFLLLAALCTDLASPSGILVMKSCVPMCPNGTVSSDSHPPSTSCCQGGGCHSSAAAGLTGSRGALWGSASASLLCALLWASW